MTICGIIAEYNPFHNGHAYHIEKTKEACGADAVIAVMSGGFTQRGEIALFDKWTRAKMAVKNGVNLVLELPFCFACGSAEYFAGGGVRLLAATGLADVLSFGSESGALCELRQAAAPETAEHQRALRHQLEKGLSFPRAQSEALQMPVHFFSPNNILATEYLNAIDRFAPSLRPVTVKRAGAGYHSDRIDTEFISATGCRRLFLDGAINELGRFVPPIVKNISLDYRQNQRYTNIYNLSGLSAGLIRRSPALLRDTAYVGEGLENRFYEAAARHFDIGEILDAVKTKRYPRTRLSRILISLMVGQTAAQLQTFAALGPGYIRVLAADETGFALLRRMKKTASLPVITNAGAHKALPRPARDMFALDCRASDIFTLGYENPALRTGRADFSAFERI